MNIETIIKQKCIEKGVTIRQMEQDLGFSNGYVASSIKPFKNHQRALAIAEYLGIPLALLTGDPQPEPQEDLPKPGAETGPDVLDQIATDHGEKASEAVRMLLLLDVEDQAEIRGEMRQMLRMQKYSRKDV